VGWKSSVYEHELFTLLASIEFEKGTNDYDKDGALRMALNDCALNKKFDQRYFVQALSRATKSLVQAKRKQAFYVTVQINVPNHFKAPSWSAYFRNVDSFLRSV